METYNNSHTRSNRLGSGLILLVIGLIFFLRNLGISLPHWVLSWHTILLVIGLLIGYRRNFTGGGWMVMVLIGAVFTFEDIIDFNMSRYYAAGAFIAVGLYLILKPTGIMKDKFKKKNLHFNLTKEPVAQTNHDAEQTEPADTNAKSTTESDYINCVNVFSGSKQHIFSKNLKGGDVVSVFGGCDLNLTQADFEGTITLDVTAIFGGVKIVIPPGWILRTNLTSIFGGTDDKRAVAPVTEGPQKVILMTGVALFGGVDIRNF